MFSSSSSHFYSYIDCHFYTSRSRCYLLDCYFKTNTTFADAQKKQQRNNSSIFENCTVRRVLTVLMSQAHLCYIHVIHLSLTNSCTSQRNYCEFLNSIACRHIARYNVLGIYTWEVLGARKALLNCIQSSYLKT